MSATQELVEQKEEAARLRQEAYPDVDENKDDYADLLDDPPQGDHQSKVEEPVQDEGYWEKRFKQKAASQDQTIYQLRQADARKDKLIKDLIRQKDELAKKQPPKELFTEEAKDRVGEQEAQDIQKAIQEGINLQTKPLLAEIERLKKQLQGVVKKDITESKNAQYRKFTEKVSSVVPNFKQLNEDRSFLAWLAKPDTFDPSITRQQRLQKAASTYDVSTAASLFKEFPARQNSNHQFSPGQRERPNPRGTKRTWTQAQIDGFNERWHNGELKPEVVAAIRKDIHAAMGDGRYLG